jgi:transcriptional regulator GlxA family with amidase domain
MPKSAATWPVRGENLISQVNSLAASGQTPTVSLQDLCSVLGVSRRLLERAFRHQLHMSPARYLRTFRLYAAWRDLVCGSGTVTSIATEYGFYELGRFSGQYKLLFGELPSETLARAKTEMAHASLLIVEDEALVAFDALRQAEFEVVVPRDRLLEPST